MEQIIKAGPAPHRTWIHFHGKANRKGQMEIVSLTIEPDNIVKIHYQKVRIARFSPHCYDVYLSKERI